MYTSYLYSFMKEYRNSHYFCISEQKITKQNLLITKNMYILAPLNQKFIKNKP